PEKSPGDTSDLPPTGEQLLDMESGKRSRFEALRHEAEKEENLDGLHSEIEQDANTVQRWLEPHRPAGHPEQPVMMSTQAMPDHMVDAGSLATVGLVLGVMAVEAGRWIHGKLERAKGE